MPFFTTRTSSNLKIHIFTESFLTKVRVTFGLLDDTRYLQLSWPGRGLELMTAKIIASSALLGNNLMSPAIFAFMLQHPALATLAALGGRKQGVICLGCLNLFNYYLQWTT